MSNLITPPNHRSSNLIKQPPFDSVTQQNYHSSNLIEQPSGGTVIKIDAQTSAIRIDDNEVSARKTWSSAKISQAKADNEAERIRQFINKYGELYFMTYDPADRGAWDEAINDAYKALKVGQSFCVPWSMSRIAQVVSANPTSDTPMIVVIDGLAYAMTPFGVEETVVSTRLGKVRIGSVIDWAENPTFIPEKGEIVIYTDKTVKDEIYYPAIKIGDGKAYVADLPFLMDDTVQNIVHQISSHTEDDSRHITQEERERWNNKLNYELNGDELILNRL